MRGKIAVALFIGWLLGVGCGLGGIAAVGGWYEYHIPVRGESPIDLINNQSWELDRYQSAADYNL